MARVLKVAGLVIGAVALLWLAVGPTPVHTVVATLVQVVNPDSNSVSTHDAGQLQPVNGACGSIVDSFGNATCNLYTVPSGKRLVVELFSYQLQASPTDANPFIVLVGLNTGFAVPTANVFSFPPVLAGSNPPRTAYADTRVIRVYFDEGQTVQADAQFGGTNATGQAFFFSGFLSNK